MSYFISGHANEELKNTLQSWIQSKQDGDESVIKSAKEHGGLLEYDKSVKELNENHKKILIIEPHADDGILSLGGTVANHFVQGDHLISLNIFSKSDDKERIRKQENRLAWEDILEGEALFADLPDENKTDIMDKIQNGKINKKVKLLLIKCLESVEKVIEQKQPDIIYFPIGIGEHLHHIIVNLCFRMIYHKYPNIHYYLYEDYPYADFNRDKYARPLFQVLSIFDLQSIYNLIDNNILNKVCLYMVYKSQHDKTYSEIVNSVTSYAKAIGYEGCIQGEDLIVDSGYERVWKVIKYKGKMSL